ncbi:MAG: hypothetical protein JST29_03775 [Bacteroidetes bacterium]|nr:hypothetical protein [Bacteroidota bacterium]
MAELANPEFVKALQNRDKSILTKIIDYVYNILGDKAKEALKKILPADKIKELRDSGTDLGMAKSILKDMLTEPIKNETNNTQFNKNKFGNSPLKDVYSDIQKNGLTKDNLQKISYYAKNIISGNAKYKRFNEREQEGLKRGGQLLTEASIITGRSGRAGETQDGRADRQEKDVASLAKSNGTWLKNPLKELTKKYGEPINAGNESSVFYDEKSGNVIKTSNISQYRDLQDALDGIVANNAKFPKAAIKVIGFGNDAETGFHIITEQPYIKEGERKATQPEIDKMMAEHGFYKNDRYGIEGRYKNGDHLANDITPKNVIRTEDGEIIPIDTIMHLNHPTWNEGGTRGEPENEIEQNNYEANKNTLEQRGIEGNKSGMGENGVQENLKGAKENNENAQYHKDELQSEEEKKLIN